MKDSAEIATHAERARALADRYWLELIEIDPLLGTESGDERFDDRLPDPSESGRARAHDAHRRALEDLAAIDRTALGPTERGTMDMLEAVARRGLSEIEHRIDRLHATSHFSGPVGTLGVVSSLQRTDTPERLDRYEARLRAFPAHLDAWTDVARDAVRGRCDLASGRGHALHRPARAPARARRCRTPRAHACVRRRRRGA